MRSSALLLALAALITGACTVQPDSDAMVGMRAGSGGSAPTGGTGGTPLPVGDGGVVVPDAPVNSSCDGGGPGSKAIGATCGCGGECASGFCADGVCCNTACSGACVSCALAGTMGECTVTDVGVPDPHGFCKKSAPETCGQDGTCNGMGGCSKHKAGTACGKAGCSGSGLVPAAACDGNGSCQAGTPINCAPSMCGNGACKLVCASNNDCVAPAICVNGSCGPRPLGVPCDTAKQCKSGFCADGVCCDSACTGKCSYCAQATSPGRCVPVPINVPDPRAAAGVTDATKICVDQKAASCGSNGRCDGNGGCQRYADGTVCKNQSCNATSNRFTARSTCAGGACVTPASSLCTPFKCAGDQRCATSCAGNGDCTTNNVCLAGSCGKKPQGAVCSNNNECGSKFCSQGLCCNEKCDGVCRSCSLDSSRGTCAAVPAGGADPSNTCKATAASTCGNDGTCNGKGGCSKFASGTVCKNAACATGVVTLASRCDGNGACKAGGTSSCGGFACDPSAPATCLNNCSNNSQCVGVPCQGNKCGLVGAGGPCEGAGDCQSGLSCWRNTVCCHTACLGDCESCETGTCNPVAAGQAPPRGGCAPSADMCGNTGSCDGRGACGLGLAAGAVCSGRCDMSNNSIITTCRGGSCSNATSRSCGAQVCGGQGQCNPCTADGDCGPGSVCNNGACQAARTCSGSATRACGMCGTQTRICNQVTGTFGDFGPCGGEHGECMPGATRACPSGGGTQTCTASCSFPAANVCNCTPITTCPMGQDCGTISDGCSGMITCGSCAAPQTCGGGGTPNHCGCTPHASCPMGQNCGTADDGCGGSATCGSCTAPQTCGGGGSPNQCGCTPRTTCPSGQDCGTADDGCGGTVSCGSCSSPETCGGSGTPNHCGCTPRTTCPTGQTCGTADDGCGHALGCGSCGNNETCDTNANPPRCVCQPAACPMGQTCGTASDGCGHTINCGSDNGGCPGGQSCDSNANPPRCSCTAQLCPMTQDCGTASDGCGHTISCGTCVGANLSCDTNANPPHCVCTPITSCPNSAECGTVSDGCGGQVTCTNTCAMGQTCGTMGADTNKCVGP
jgi:hypothetical protein